MQLVLSSSSSARQALLKRFKIDFSTFSPDVDETAFDNETIIETVSRLAIKKAKAATNAFPHALIIGSDQLIAVEDQILGKPGNHENAQNQLALCSNKILTSYTSLCLFNANTGETQRDVIEYQVKFKPLNETLIEQYLQADQPYQCAGSIKAESLGPTLFEWMRGDDPNALTGLPLIRLNTMLTESGFNIFSQD